MGGRGSGGEESCEWASMVLIRNDGGISLVRGGSYEGTIGLGRCIK